MLNRSIAPPFAELKGVDLTKPDIQQLDDNWSACVLHDSRHPVVVAELIFANGRWCERQPGYGYFAAKMLMEGTPKYQSSEISKALAREGSFLEILPGVDFVNIRLHALKRNFRSSMQLLIHLMAESSFPTKEFESLKRIRQANIRNQLARSSQLANAKFAEALFGVEHPYGKIMTPELVEQCTIQGVKEEYASGFFNRPKIMLSGDVADEVDWLTKQLKSLGITDHHVEIPDLEPSPSREIIDKGGNQASLRMGSRTIDRKHEDIFELTIANRLLGGFFGSRLMKNIREEKGLSYGIYSHLAHFAHASYWVIGSEVSKDDLQVAETEILHEIEGLATTPPREEELTLLKNYSTGRMLGELDSPLSLSSLYKPQFLLGMPLDYHERYLHKLNTIKPEEISSMVTRHLRTDRLTTLAVV